MIDVYSWPTPNGQKVHIMLEECGLDYTVRPVDILAGAQFTPDFLAISPNNKIPAIVDSNGPDGKPIALFESGAILIYLAGKTGRFLPSDERGKFKTLEWLMFQMASLGPMLGQAHHFRMSPKPVPYAIKRYTNEARRLYNVLDRRLAEAPWLAGGEYTIADIAVWPWTALWKLQGVNPDDYPNFHKWFKKIKKRPAVQRGMAVMAELRNRKPDDKAREILYGKQQYARR